MAAARRDAPLSRSKVTSLADAVRAHVPAGSAVALGLQLESSIPFAFGHELIRQRVRRLTLIGPISDMLFDQLIGAGCVERVVAAWVGNVSAGLGHNYRRACEHGIPQPLVVHEHSNFSLALGLLAASLGMPYAPTRTLLGSDLVRTNPDVAVGEWEGEPVVRVTPIRPDVAVLHVQRASAEGLAHAWGNLGVAEAAALAAKTVIVCAEEVVPRAELVADPNRVLAPLHKVVAVVEAPGGARPSPVPGYYDRDHDAFAAYHQVSRTVEGFALWLEESVL